MTKKIYIRLLNEGIDVSRPTLGRDIGDGVYEIFAAPDFDQLDEEWGSLQKLVFRFKNSSLTMGTIS